MNGWIIFLTVVVLVLASLLLVAYSKAASKSTEKFENIGAWTSSFVAPPTSPAFARACVRECASDQCASIPRGTIERRDCLDRCALQCHRA